MRHRIAQGVVLTALGLTGLAVAGCAGGPPAASTAANTAASNGTSTGASNGTSTGARARASGAALTATGVLFPAQVGNTWVYTVRSSLMGPGTETNRITAVTPAAGGQRAAMTSGLRLGGAATPIIVRTIVLVRSDGSVTLGSVSFGGVRFKSPNIVWPSSAELAPGHARTSTVTMTTLGIATTEQVTVKDAGSVLVSVPAGTYHATLFVETVTAGSRTSAVTRNWDVNGIGPVKTQTITSSAGQQIASSTDVLTSFTRGN